MAATNFFSVERKGYIRVSDLFADVMSDMIAHGFTLVNSSNGYPINKLVTKLVTNGSSAGITVGTKLYIKSTGVLANDPNGIPRSNNPYVLATDITGGNIKISDVHSDYDFPIWNQNVIPTGAINLYTTSDLAPGSQVPGANITITQRSATVSDAPADSGYQVQQTTANIATAYSFTLEAGPEVDPWNGATDPVKGGALAPNDTQPWRVQFAISDEQKAAGSVATKLQMDYDPVLGRIAISQVTDDDGTVVDNVGSLGAVQPEGKFSDTDLNQGFYNRKLRVSNTPQTFPLSYALSITDRGFFLGVYEGSWSTTRAATTTNSNYFNWVLVQRPVDRTNGRTLVTGKAPVFCVNSVNYKYYKTIVRESDVLHPTVGPSAVGGTGNVYIKGAPGVDFKQWYATGLPDKDLRPTKFDTELEVGGTLYHNNGTIIGKIKQIESASKLYFTSNVSTTGNSTIGLTYKYTPNNIQSLRVLADAHSPDSHMLFNSINQVALTEDKKYLLSFPHNLTTPRYRYTEELDMIGMTSADLVMSGQVIQFQTYGEIGPRTYWALPPSGALNTGLRAAVLWAPPGPRWITPDSGSLGEIRPGDSPEPTFVAIDIDGQPVTTFTVIRGTLPTGLGPISSDGTLLGTVGLAEFTESTEIKFTIAAYNTGDSGFAMRDFWFTYIPT